uniref:Coagulation factor IX n=1 Tax=Myripristis murdjan TaxID=586833 RepID=A0A667ZE48_9TELE
MSMFKLFDIKSSVFVSQQSAAMVLRRFRRYNSGGLEELPFKNKDNLERECKEEVCNMEEAREVFENDEKTVGDEDQCLSNPCQNEGVCEDGIASYVCWCTSDFSGKNCEIEVAKQCSVNNGGCSHFCAMQSGHVVCQCAAGYTLGQDKKSYKKQLPSWAFYATMPTITEQQNEDKRIVGGNEASPGEIPWQVRRDAGRREGREHCFSMFSTKSHCEAILSTQSLHLGEHDLHKSEGTEKDHFVAEQIIHPHYNDQRSQYNHDIALLKLSAPVELSNQRRPICLGPKDFTETLLREASTSLVSGWGKLRFQGPEARKLQKLEVPYVERTRCKGSSREQITRFMFCAGYHSEPMDSCQGDSGGPHASNYKGTWFLTGIVSWGEDCAKEGKYGVYTRVSRYYPWISQTTGIRISS